MKTCANLLAGAEGTRSGVLAAKRTKPAVPFAVKKVEKGENNQTRRLLYEF